MPPVVIAHRGASGYLPEHTLAAKAMAHAQGADYLEQDVVLTRDEVPIVLHDIYLDAVSDVAKKFPGRAREDGRHYSIDFTLAEIRTLSLSERFSPKTGEPVFPKRFPIHTGNFRIPTLEEELEFIAGMNHSTGRVAGIYPEIKQPELHHVAGKDVSGAVLQVLTRHGFQEAHDQIYLQCFDSSELRRIRHQFHSRLKLIQLLEQNDWLKPGATRLQLESGCAAVATYAQGIGPSLYALFEPERRNGQIVHTPLVEVAHAAGLLVHPWTYRVDALPTPFKSFEELHAESLKAGVDGVFTDFPDKSLTCLHAPR